MGAGVVTIDLTDGLRAVGQIAFGDPNSAQFALDRARTANTTALAAIQKLENQEGWDTGALASMGVPLVRAEKLLRERMEFSADGAVLRVKLSLTSTELNGITPHNWPVPPLWVSAQMMHEGHTF
jgi:hypothetical protein